MCSETRRGIPPRDAKPARPALRVGRYLEKLRGARHNSPLAPRRASLVRARRSECTPQHVKLANDRGKAAAGRRRRTTVGSPASGVRAASALFVEPFWARLPTRNDYDLSQMLAGEDVVVDKVGDLVGAHRVAAREGSDDRDRVQRRHEDHGHRWLTAVDAMGNRTRLSAQFVRFLATSSANLLYSQFQRTDMEPATTPPSALPAYTVK